MGDPWSLPRRERRRRPGPRTAGRARRGERRERPDSDGPTREGSAPSQRFAPSPPPRGHAPPGAPARARAPPQPPTVQTPDQTRGVRAERRRHQRDCRARDAPPTSARAPSGPARKAGPRFPPPRHPPLPPRAGGLFTQAFACFKALLRVMRARGEARRAAARRPPAPPGARLIAHTPTPLVALLDATSKWRARSQRRTVDGARGSSFTENADRPERNAPNVGDALADRDPDVAAATPPSRPPPEKMHRSRRARSNRTRNPPRSCRDRAPGDTCSYAPPPEHRGAPPPAAELALAAGSLPAGAEQARGDPAPAHEALGEPHLSVTGKQLYSGLGP